MKKRKRFTLPMLSHRYFFNNLKQHAITLIAILLTTIMFTVIFTIETSVTKSSEQATCRQVGSIGDIIFKDITFQQHEKISKHPVIKEYGYSISVGMGANPQLETVPTEIRYGDDNYAKMSFDYPTVGNMPKKENEFATTKAVLDSLKIPHRIGEKVKIKNKKDPNSKESVEWEFVLSGYWEGDELAPVNMLWVSKKFIRENITQNEIDGNVYSNIVLKNHRNPDKIAKKILSDSGLSGEDIKHNGNFAYVGARNVKTMVLYGLGIVLIMISGYLIISNTIQISLSKEIQFYGRLKTIGMTSKQISHLLFKQVIYLCMIGIPMGILGGYGICFWLLPLVLYNQSGAYILSGNLMVFCFTGFFALVTVFISSAKAIRVMGGLSPLEALRFQIQKNGSKKSIKKTKNDGRLHRMALLNIKRNPRRTVITVISLSLGFIMMNSIYTIGHSYDVEKYLKDIIPSDFYFGDSSSMNDYYNPNNQTLNQELLNQVKTLKGYEDMGSVYFHQTEIDLSKKAHQRLIKFYKQDKVYKYYSTDKRWIEEYEIMRDKGKMDVVIYGEDDFVIKKQNIYHGTFDQKKFDSGKYVLEVGMYPYDGDDGDKGELGEKVVIDGTEYEIMAYVDVLSLESKINLPKDRPSFPTTYVLPSETYLKKYKDPYPMIAYADFNKNGELGAQEFFEKYQQETDSYLGVRSRSTYEEEYRSESMAQNVMGETLSIVIAFIGFINFLNTLVISMISRRKEFALMQSIGMTKGQLLITIIYEGIYFTLFTMLISIPASGIISMIFVKKYLEPSWTLTYHFTLMPVLVSVILLILLALFIPVIYLRNNEKTTAIQRLRG